jgi:hypothetical protein
MAKEFHNLPIIRLGRFLGGGKFAKPVGAVFFINHCNEAFISLAKAYTLVSGRIASSDLCVGSILCDASLSKVGNAIVAFIAVNMVGSRIRPSIKGEAESQVMSKINPVFPTYLPIAVWADRSSWPISRNAFLDDEPPKVARCRIVAKNLTKLFNRKPVGIDRFCAHGPTLTVAHMSRQGNPL